MVIVIGNYYLMEGRLVVYSIKEDALQEHAINFAKEAGINNIENIVRMDKDGAVLFLFEEEDKYVVLRYSKALLLQLYRSENTKNTKTILTKKQLTHDSYGVTTPLKFIVFSISELSNGTFKIKDSSEKILWKDRLIHFALFYVVIEVSARYRRKTKE